MYMPFVEVRDNEAFEVLLKRFKRQCERGGILSDIKRRQHFEKPSETKKRQKVDARKKLLKKLALERKRMGLR